MVTTILLVMIEIGFLYWLRPQPLAGKRLAEEKERYYQVAKESELIPTHMGDLGR